MDKLRIMKYLRLSSDDGNEGESNSIINQRELLDNYIFVTFIPSEIEVSEKVDDGYSGTNFQRPGIIQVIKLAKAGKIDCIIVKDFSRFGRNHTRVGYYMENLFPSLGIRFISVNDNYDSNDYIGTTGGMDVALKNIINEMYSIDLSQKVKSSKLTMMKQGLNLAPYGIYGYVKENRKLVIDAESAVIVRRMFEMRAAGYKTIDIAKLFNNEGIMTPGEYKNKKFGSRKWDFGIKSMPIWTSATVQKCLSDIRYTGVMLSYVTHRTRVGDGKSTVRSTEEEKILVPNTHEAIVDMELFTKVQSMKSRSRRTTITKPSPRGLFKCGGCGHTLSKTNNGKDLICSFYTYNMNDSCIHECIRVEELLNLVNSTLSIQMHELVATAKVIKSALEQKEDQKKKRELNLKTDIAQLKKARFQMYEDFKAMKITAEELKKGREGIQEKLKNMEKDLAGILSCSIADVDLNTKADRILNYKFQGTIEDKLREEFIDSIFVYHDKRIEIKWKFTLTDGGEQHV